jgi:Lrp/AsnC family transcriptional regulator, regulator for asnA, asnC and gidA
MTENQEGLDDLDFKILSFLQKDGRMSLTDIAENVGMSVGGVRKRFTKLIEEQTLQVIGRVNPKKVGFNAYASLLIAVRPAELIEEVANQLVEIQEVSFLAIIVGDYDIEVNVICRDNEHLTDVLNKKVHPIKGISHTKTTMYLKIVKWGRQPDLLMSRKDTE